MGTLLFWLPSCYGYGPSPNWKAQSETQVPVASLASCYVEESGDGSLSLFHLCLLFGAFLKWQHKEKFKGKQDGDYEWPRHMKKARFCVAGAYSMDCCPFCTCSLGPSSEIIHRMWWEPTNGIRYWDVGLKASSGLLIRVWLTPNQPLGHRLNGSLLSTPLPHRSLKLFNRNWSEITKEVFPVSAGFTSILWRVQFGNLWLQWILQLSLVICGWVMPSMGYVARKHQQFS